MGELAQLPKELAELEDLSASIQTILKGWKIHHTARTTWGWGIEKRGKVFLAPTFAGLCTIANESRVQSSGGTRVSSSITGWDRKTCQRLLTLSDAIERLMRRWHVSRDFSGSWSARCDEPVLFMSRAPTFVHLVRMAVDVKILARASKPKPKPQTPSPHTKWRRSSHVVLPRRANGVDYGTSRDVLISKGKVRVWKTRGHTAWDSGARSYFSPEWILDVGKGYYSQVTLHEGYKPPGDRVTSEEWQSWIPRIAEAMGIACSDVPKDIPVGDTLVWKGGK